MTTVRHIARAIGSTSSTAPERTPLTVAIRDGTPITTTFQPHNG